MKPESPDSVRLILAASSDRPDSPLGGSRSRSGGSTARARAARRERQAAELLGTKRVHRSRFQSAPDVDPRDWKKEATEEALDLAVYLAIDLLGTKL